MNGVVTKIPFPPRQQQLFQLLLLSSKWRTPNLLLLQRTIQNCNSFYVASSTKRHCLYRSPLKRKDVTEAKVERRLFFSSRSAAEHQSSSQELSPDPSDKFSSSVEYSEQKSPNRDQNLRSSMTASEAFPKYPSLEDAEKQRAMREKQREMEQKTMQRKGYLILYMFGILFLSAIPVVSIMYDRWRDRWEE